MKKIIITGGLGYIGSELCKIYSGYSHINNITVIDNRFISEKVNQLRKWNINFIHGDILDKKLVKKNFFDADIVHHLAGITLVPKIKEKKNKKIENLIYKIAVEGTQNILESISNNCKIIFPSTHVIYEGLKKIKKDIKESEKPCPILSYSKSKYKNEIQLKKSNHKYIILRLSTVYGYSGDTTRMDIMPNLFAKITSQNGTIKLFNKGVQLKSMVPLIDVARTFKFFEERNDITSEIFNVSKDLMTVKAVAQTCKKFNKNIKIINTKDKIPNLGFGLSNKKLLKTGFKFLYSFEQNIREMVIKWSKQYDKNQIYKINKGEDNFIDSRGKINNYELTEPINLIGLITSKKGSVRANHYHPQQEQKCLFIDGQTIEVVKDRLIPNSNKITNVVRGGETSIIKPNVSHAMIFSQDTTFLNLVRGERDHDKFGISHTIKDVIVTDNEKKDLLNYYKFECRSCENKDLKRVVSLGYQPLANNLLKKKGEKYETYPLEINFCEKCYNCQLSVAVDPKKMFENYLYRSSTSKIFLKHFEKGANKFIEKLKLKPEKSYIIDIGSNDGAGLKPFKELGFKNILGIEPAKNLSKIANKNKIKTFNGFLNQANLKFIKKDADLILASNVFAHSDTLEEMANCMKKLLKKDGTIIIEVQHLLRTIFDLSFDNIYHEHYNYWSLLSLQTFLKKVNLIIYNVEKVNTHGGSIRVFVTKKNQIKINENVDKMIKEEKRRGLDKFKTYQKFGLKIYEMKNNFLKNIKFLKKKYKNIIGYGAPAKATTLLNFFNVENYIDYIIEDNEKKHQKFVPGVKIPIFSKKNIKTKQNLIIVFAWNFFNDIKIKNKHLAKKFINSRDLLFKRFYDE